ncbi:hypothetical protein M3226_29320 [Neobacillus cucumis]|uniref:hypothetical protein n=1 Tax=Neobacillus cucumis TaxID=1740721 RepID=UPI0020406DFB|nr:hypothetical protein [Neobacillus cucumis]MCM3729672.1 hypothetical protein [Neobacillus cucumis]
MIEVLSGWIENIYVIGRDVEESSQNMKAEFINHPFYKTYEYIIPVQLMCSNSAVKRSGSKYSEGS